MATNEPTADQAAAANAEPTQHEMLANMERQPSNDSMVSVVSKGGTHRMVRSTITPPKRAISSIKKSKKQHVVRTSLLSQIFFPHYHGGEGEEDDDGPHARPLQWLADLLQSKRVQVFFLVMLVLDVFLVISEMIIASHKQCFVHVYHGYNNQVFPGMCTNATLGIVSTTERKVVAIPSTAQCAFSAESKLSHALHTAEVVLNWCSRGVLMLFGVELVLLMISLRERFFKNKLYVLDVFIIGISLFLEFTFGGNEDTAAIGLIVFIRCWRFARILHGVGLSVHEVDEIEMEHEVEEHGEASEAVQAGGAEPPSGTSDGNVMAGASEGDATAVPAPKKMRRVVYRVIRQSHSEVEDDD